jgi:hypothetical protein
MIIAAVVHGLAVLGCSEAAEGYDYKRHEVFFRRASHYAVRFSPALVSSLQRHGQGLTATN